MHRLSGEDSGFLSMEQPEQAMNTIAVGILQPPDAETPPLTLADVRAHVARRLDQLPSFRWRIVPVPFGLHHPVAVRDPRFDLDDHLRQLTLGPGQTIEEAFARLAEQHLDRRRPLWQLTLVHGLADGRQALILRYHHALADGVAALTTFERVFADHRTPPIPGASLPWTPEPIPGPLGLLLGALADRLRSLPRLPALLWRTRRGIAAVDARRAAAAVAVPAFSGAAPNSALNDAFTAPRTYRRAELPLAEVKAIKDATATTLNDVVLATVAGAARAYLAERGELPDLPLLASVPVAYEAPDAPLRQAGNRFWSFTTTLATDEADPILRLRAIGATAAEAKAQLAALGPDLVPTWLDHLPPCISRPGARALIERLRALEGEGTVDANLLISNIRGPSTPWTLLGRTVVDLHVDGPPSNGVGLNVMLWSYGDRLLLGLLAFADALRDPDAFAGHLTASFAELRNAALSD